MKRIVSVLLLAVLMLFCAAAMAEGFSFRNGITWGMTYDEVDATEGAEKDTYESTTDEGRAIKGLEFQDVSVAGTKADAAFREEALAAYEQRLKEFRDPTTEF